MFVRHHHGPGRMYGPGGMCGPGHMHGPGSMPGPGARLFERGGIKFAILGMLKDKPRHGYDIIREMEERSGGFYSPSPGVVYPTLQALEDQDLVSSTTEDGKKVYAITEAGVAYLEEHKERAASHRERWEAHWGAGPEGESWEAVSGIRETLREVKRAVRGNAGDSAKLKEIGVVLQEAAAKIRDIIRK
jgi:DNA-binding PadR family transcriptional regulator